MVIYSLNNTFARWSFRVLLGSYFNACIHIKLCHRHLVLAHVITPIMRMSSLIYPAYSVGLPLCSFIFFRILHVMHCVTVCQLAFSLSLSLFLSLSLSPSPPLPLSVSLSRSLSLSLSKQSELFTVWRSCYSMAANFLFK